MSRPSLPDVNVLRQLTDNYLLGLARKMGGVLAAFARTIPIKAVVGAMPTALHVIASGPDA